MLRTARTTSAGFLLRAATRARSTTNGCVERHAAAHARREEHGHWCGRRRIAPVSVLLPEGRNAYGRVLRPAHLGPPLTRLRWILSRLSGKRRLCPLGRRPSSCVRPVPPVGRRAGRAAAGRAEETTARAEAVRLDVRAEYGDRLGWGRHHPRFVPRPPLRAPVPAGGSYTPCRPVVPVDQVRGEEESGCCGGSASHISTKPQTFFGSNQKLFVGKRQYDADDAASVYLPGSKSLMEPINPGNAVAGTILFDVPAGAKPTKIELHDSVFSGGVNVALR
jgi:Domain of unknown function (DUF4352)